MKTYKSAPLPFMGQKRRFLEAFKEALNQFPDDAVFVDLFGGSGLLSHTVKRHRPGATVIYNDYDGFAERLQAIPATNALLADIRAIVQHLPKDKQIKGKEREAVLYRIAQEKGFVDYVTLSSSLLFSMNYVASYEALAKASLYNVVKQADYDASGYLEGLERVQQDYKVLYTMYKDNPKVVFLVDPPYLSTESGTYKNYWKLSDYLDVLDVLVDGRYFFFTSNKSHLVELCQWVSDRTSWANPFAGASTSTTNNSMNYAATYTDYMICKK